MVNGIRNAAVAGYFYPGSGESLSRMVEGLLAPSTRIEPPRSMKALIVPHAGYDYSGMVAGQAYSLLPLNSEIRNILIVGPAHRYPVKALAVPSFDYFQTPFGAVKVNRKLIGAVLDIAETEIIDKAHVEEHCIEVQLPFLQKVIDDFSIVPVLTGGDDDVVFRMLVHLDPLVDLVVVSSDLSHYLSYNDAVRFDEKTRDAILSLDEEALCADSACGYAAVRGLLRYAREKKMSAMMIDMRNSGDTSGTRSQVVGYGAFAFG